MMQIEDQRSFRPFLMSEAVRDCENILLFPVSSVGEGCALLFPPLVLRLALQISTSNNIGAAYLELNYLSWHKVFV